MEPLFNVGKVKNWAITTRKGIAETIFASNVPNLFGNQSNFSKDSLEKLLNETSNNEDFQSYIKNNHCYTIDILDNTKISKIIDKIKNLDFTHKKTRAQGLDGFSFDFEYNNVQYNLLVKYKLGRLLQLQELKH